MICKIEGEHKNHNTMLLSKSQYRLETALAESVTSFEGYQDILILKTLRANEWFNGTKNKMKETRELIQEQFAILRDAINKKEKEIIQHLETNEAEYDTTNKFIHSAQELMREIPATIMKIEKLFSERDIKRKITVDVAEEILFVKKKVNSGKEIIKKLDTYENCKMFVDTEKFRRETKRGLDEINRIGEISVKRVLCSAPTGFVANKICSVFVSLSWDRGVDFDEYIVSYREGGGEWNEGDKIIHLSKNNDHCIVYPLKPERGYEFRIMGKIKGVETKWSEVVCVKTKAKLVIPVVKDISKELQEKMDNVKEVVKVLSIITSLPEERG